MASIDTLYMQSDLTSFKRGYVFDVETEEWVCLICGYRYTDGEIIPLDGHYYTAEKAIALHINKEHESMLHYLLNLDKKDTGLSEIQTDIIALSAAGLSDQEVARSMGGLAASTVRNHRFQLREKAKQARILLAIMELVEDKIPIRRKLVAVPRTTPLVDERFAVTKEEFDKVIASYMDQKGQIKQFPSREKKRLILLQEIIKSFQKGIIYTEKEVNALLKPRYNDHVLLRRYLVDYKLLGRKQDGSEYWVL